MLNFVKYVLYLHQLRWAYGFYFSCYYGEFTLVDFQMLNQHSNVELTLHSWDKSHLLWCIAHLIYCWVLFATVVFRNFTSMFLRVYWSIAFLSCNISVRFWGSKLLLSCRILFWKVSKISSQVQQHNKTNFLVNKHLKNYMIFIIFSVSFRL